jgi:threonine/homoserine/homoserine lactone efflux protein
VVSGDQLAAFAVASFVLIVIPGPGVLFVIGRALAHGRAVALASVAGHAAGNWVVAVCVALGVGTIVERSADVFTAIRLAGAAYLIWLGIQAFRRRHALADVLTEAAAPRGGVQAVREGFVVGVTNPKAVILFAAVLPQFVNRSAGHPRPDAAAERDLHRDRPGLGQLLGTGREHRAGLVRPLSAPSQPGRRRRRPGDHRAGGHPRRDRPQGLSSGRG